MATFTKITDFTFMCGKGYYSFSTHNFKMALTDTAPSASDTVYLPGSLHPVPANANGYTPGGYMLTKTWSITNSVSRLIASVNIVVTATTGGIGPFRYVILYDDSMVAPIVDGLVGFMDYGSSISLAVNETFTIDVTSAPVLTMG